MSTGTSKLDEIKYSVNLINNAALSHALCGLCTHVITIMQILKK